MSLNSGLNNEFGVSKRKKNNKTSRTFRFSKDGSPGLRRVSMLWSRNHMRSSPYVGWFRHAPPSPDKNVDDDAVPLFSVFLQQKTLPWPRRRHWNDEFLYMESSHRMRSSPYLGWFRHSPPSTAREIRKHLMECLVSENASSCVGQQKVLLVRTPTKSPYHDSEFFSANRRIRCCLIDGKLNGGSPLSQNPTPSTSATNQDVLFPPLTTLPHTNKQSDENDDISVASSTSSTSFLAGGDTKESATLIVLSKLANLILSPVTGGSNKAFARRNENQGNETVSPSNFQSRCLLIQDGNMDFSQTSVRDGTTDFVQENSCDDTQIQECNLHYTHDNSRLNNNGGEERSQEEADDEHSSISGQELETQRSTSFLPPRIVSIQRPTSSAAHDATRELMPIDEISSSAYGTAGSGHGLLTEVDSVTSSAYSIQNSPGEEHMAATTNPLFFSPSIFTTSSDFHPGNNTANGLDLVITQLDIARMVRNASRHLDVESILSLPTITYRSPESQQGASILECKDIPVQPNDILLETDNRRIAAESAPADAWSWMMVPSDPKHEEDDRTTKTMKADCDLQEKPNYSSKTDTRDSNNDVCVICLERFCDGDRLRVLPCNHLFHMGCIDKWLSGTYSDQECFTSGCPTCKKRPDWKVEEAREDDSNKEPDMTTVSLSSSTGEVPSWAFARVGNAMAARESFMED